MRKEYSLMQIIRGTARYLVHHTRDILDSYPSFQSCRTDAEYTLDNFLKQERERSESSREAKR